MTIFVEAIIFTRISEAVHIRTASLTLVKIMVIQPEEGELNC